MTNEVSELISFAISHSSDMSVSLASCSPMVYTDNIESIDSPANGEIQNTHPEVPVTQDFTVAPSAPLDPWFVTGFTDGEGTFFVNPHKTNTSLGYKFGFEFKVVQKSHSVGVLYGLQKFFGCGNVVSDNNRTDTMKLRVTSGADIRKYIIPHFEKYPLATSKHLNFLDFKKVMDIIESGDHLTKEGVSRIMEIKSHMNTGRTFEDKWNYLSDKSPIKLEPHWVAGFIDGEGSFQVELADRGAGTRTNTYVACVGSLQIAQSSHDVEVLSGIRDFFNQRGGKATLKPKYDIKDLKSVQSVRTVSRFVLKQDDVLIEFMDQHPIYTRKLLDYNDFKLIMTMKKGKKHLTPSGRTEMAAIKARMNFGRSS